MAAMPSEIPGPVELVLAVQGALDEVASLNQSPPTVGWTPPGGWTNAICEASSSHARHPASDRRHCPHPAFRSRAFAGAFEDGAAAYERDYATALRLFQPLADQGDASAQFKVGSMYAFGEGVPRNFTEAGEWFRRAADQGHAAAQFNLGAMYAEGLGLAQDYQEAARWYRKAADQRRRQNAVQPWSHVCGGPRAASGPH